MKQYLFFLLFIPIYSNAFWENFFQEPCIAIPKPTYQATIVLAPTGSSTTPGRKIKNNFEYILSHQFIRALQHELLEIFPTLQIRIPNECNVQLDPLQLATISNSAPANLLVKVQFYLETDIKSQVYLYRCSYGQEFVSRRWDLSWCPVEQAPLINKTKTKKWITQLYSQLSTEQYKPWFTVASPIKVPLKPMLGIIAPAILVEIGLKDDAEWTNFVKPLANSLKPVIEEILTESKEDHA